MRRLWHALWWYPQRLGYIIRPYDMLADRRRWCWQPRQRCEWSWQRLPGGGWYSGPEEPKPADPIEIPHDVFENEMLAAFRDAAHHDEWERSITHGADRTLSGLRAALRSAGITVAPPVPPRRSSRTGAIRRQCFPAAGDQGATGTATSSWEPGS